MQMHQTIVSRAALIPACGEVGSALLDAFCTVAEAELRRRLPEDVTGESLGERFVCAAALLAASMCAAAGDGCSAMRAGNVSVSRGDARRTASALRSEAFAMLGDVVGSDGFAFLGVEL